MAGFQFHSSVREPVFAGRFYPGTKRELARQLDELFQEAKKNTLEGKLRAIVSPHAGYVFSGQVAASAFNQIPDHTKYKRVFVLASSHRFHFKGAAVYCSGNYKTPLGEIKVDTKLAKQLIQSSEIFNDKPEAHENEHSLEVQLPFLQHQLGDSFLLVPIILGINKPNDSKKIAEKLKPYFNDENLFVISTDFSHYPAFQDAIENDLLTADAICSNQPDELLNVLERNKKREIPNLATSLCGWTSVLTLMHITQQKKVEYNKIEYKNSGHADTFTDKDRVVGYWSIAITEKKENQSFYISEAEQNELLQKARNAIQNNIKTGKWKLHQPLQDNTFLNEPAGAFVSVYVNEKLRGCIGNFAREDKTVNEVVQKSAVSASRDVRFEVIREDDLENMTLEISVISPMKKINSIDEIELGRHGIYIKKDFKSGTFLPQVAKKTGWNLEQFLGHCSRDKAGLGWDGWKNADIFIYEAFIFRG